MGFDGAEQVWKALSDPTRRRLLDLLRGGPQTTGALCAEFTLSRYAVMKHLTVLESAQMLVVRRRGRERFNYLNPVPLQQVIDRWVGRYSALWSRALVDLKQVVERDVESSQATETEEDAMEEIGNFDIRQEVRISAPVERVFKAISEEVGSWWAFRTLGDDARMHIEPQAGGRFYEEDGAGKCALWGTIQRLESPNILRLAGPCGLSGMVVAHFGYELETEGKDTVVRIYHRAMGEVTEETGENFRNGWGTLCNEHLKPFVEKNA